MKKILFLAMAVMAITGCESNRNEEIPLAPEDNPKEYFVSLGLSGEITSSEQPMAKSILSGNDLYGVQIYSRGQGDENYRYYAYGVFDDPSRIAVKLLGGYTYKFECSIVVNGKNIVESRDNVYSTPFSGASGFGRKLDNSFHILTKDAIWGLGYGNTKIKSAEGYQYVHPNTDRYYGVVDSYVPDDNNTKISIYMKRTVFEAKFIANGLTEGRLIIEMSDAPPLYINATDTRKEAKDIFTFYRVSQAYEQENYSETIATTVTWEKENGTTVPVVSSKEINFKRRTTTTSTIDLTFLSGTSESVEIIKEPSNLTEGDTIILL